MKITYYMAAAALTLTSMTGCTNLDETIYDQVGSDNYYNTKMDVIRMAFRPFEHGYHSVQQFIPLNELTADLIITPTRDGWWDDSGKWRTMHDHTYDVENGIDKIKYEWDACFQGVGQCNYAIEKLDELNPSDFGFTKAEFDNLKGQNRALRAWYYLRLLDAFRNIPYTVSFNDPSKNISSQVEPKMIFELIENDLKDGIELLDVKQNKGGNLNIQGHMTKAAAAALLVRLYQNAEVYIGENRLADCERYAQDIVDGKYGYYEVASRWDAPFDWNNETCDEVIFAFPGSTQTHWHFSGDCFWWTVPAKFSDYVGDKKATPGEHNTKYAASPSYDNDGHLFSYELGMPIEKFRKYPGDERMKLYRNTGTSKREGMFVYGSLPYTDDLGNTQYVTTPTLGYKLYIRDAVGQFKDLQADRWPGGESKMENGDHNSGWHYVKYPMYADEDPGQDQCDYVLIRLPEVIYALAECKLRNGDAATAGKLLNSVRKRYYPEENWQKVLYAPEGTATLDLMEMLDEWGREYFGEGRRRIDLIRFGKFHDKWWDKLADIDTHTAIFPIMRDILGSNEKLQQNPGYGN